MNKCIRCGVDLHQFTSGSQCCTNAMCDRIGLFTISVNELRELFQKEWIIDNDSDVEDCDCCDGSGEHSEDEKVFDCM